MNTPTTSIASDENSRVNFNLSDDEDDATIISDIENIANLNELQDEEEADEPMEDNNSVYQEIRSNREIDTKMVDQETLPKEFQDVNFPSSIVSNTFSQENSDIAELNEKESIEDNVETMENTIDETIDDNIEEEQDGMTDEQLATLAGLEGFSPDMVPEYDDDSEASIDDKDKDSDYEEKSERKRKRRRKERPSSPTDKKAKKANERRNIRKLMGESKLDADTLSAQQEETKRIQRLNELREQFLKEQKAEQLAKAEAQAKAEAEANRLAAIRKAQIMLAKQRQAEQDFDVVEISSSESEDEELSDDVVMVPSAEEEEDEPEPEDGKSSDLNNSGSHTNDEMNKLDSEGRVLVNIGHPADEPDIYLLPQIARTIKPHQIGGIRFLYDNLIEGIGRFKGSNGFGCILAHSMGLGKTIQLVSFIDIFLRHTEGKHVMVIVPVNTLQNWSSEFQQWIPKPPKDYVSTRKAKSPSHTNEIKIEPIIKTEPGIFNEQTSATLNSNLNSIPLLPQSNTIPVTSEINSFNIKAESKDPIVNESTKSDEKENTEQKNNETKPPEEPYDRSGTVFRTFGVHLLNDNLRTMAARAKVVDIWYNEGGVLLLGYEMYRLMTSRKPSACASRSRRKKNTADSPSSNSSNATATTPTASSANASATKLTTSASTGDVIDLVDEKNDAIKEMISKMHEALIKPGPDLVICDEGHRIKNSHASISKALKNIKTKRRVVLTGYPLQNNLLEYWCMVDFVRPNFLGTKSEFSNMFERPIMNGQCVDSTDKDVRLMRFRSHVLHSLLEGFVQRRSESVLTSQLPLKVEYTLLVRMSPIQRKLYKEFMDLIENGQNQWIGSNPLKAFAVCCKIWNHPDVLHLAASKHKKTTLIEDNDIDLDEIAEKKAANGGTIVKPEPSTLTTSESLPNLSEKKESPPSVVTDTKKENQSISYEWAENILKTYESGVLENSGKMVIMMDLIDEAIKSDEKTLIFSQSLFTLNLIEEFLSKRKISYMATVPEAKPKPQTNYPLRRNNSTPLYTDITNAFSSMYAPGKDMNQLQMMNNAQMPAYSYYGGYNLPQSVPLSANGMPMASLNHLAAMQPNGMQMYPPNGMQVPNAMDMGAQWQAYNHQNTFMPSGFPATNPLIPQMSMYPQSTTPTTSHSSLLASTPSLPTSTPPESPRNTRSASTTNSTDLDSKDTIKEEPEVKKEKKKYLKTEKWQKNVNYLRLDGSTSAIEREKLINQFNGENNEQYHVFLLSTRAGCLGINLIGANRVIVFDASWNPCHDAQAVCRVYRYGQQKNCYVYRLVTDNTMEKKIYDRQLNKQGISDRVVDEINQQSSYTKRQVDVLIEYTDLDLPEVNLDKCLDRCKDPILSCVMNRHHSWITKEPAYLETESTFTEKKLTKTEKQMAKRSYEMEKRMTGQRMNFSTVYTRGPNGEMIPTNRPVARVGPIMSQSRYNHRTNNTNRSTGISSSSTVLRPGVSIQHIVTTTAIQIPGSNTSTNSGGNCIAAGENVLVIKTPRGVYLRTKQGKIFAVRTTPSTSIKSSVATSGTTPKVTTTMSTSKSIISTTVKPKSLIVNRSMIKNDVLMNKLANKVVLNSQKKAAILNSVDSDVGNISEDGKSLVKPQSISLLKTSNSTSIKSSNTPSIVIKQNSVTSVTTTKVDRGVTRIIPESKTIMTSIAPAMYTVTRLSSNEKSHNKEPLTSMSISKVGEITTTKSNVASPVNEIPKELSASDLTDKVDVNVGEKLDLTSIDAMIKNTPSLDAVTQIKPLVDKEENKETVNKSMEINNSRPLEQHIPVSKSIATLPLNPVNSAPLVNPLNSVNQVAAVNPMNPIIPAVSAPLAPKPINPSLQVDSNISNPFFPNFSAPRPLVADLSTSQSNITLPTPLPPHSLANPYAAPVSRLHPSNPLSSSSMIHHNLAVPSALPPSLSTPLAPTAYQPYQTPTQPMYQQHPWSNSTLGWNQQYPNPPQYPPQYPSYPGYANTPAYPAYQQPTQPTPSDWFSTPGYPSSLTTPTPQYPAYNPATSLYQPIPPFTPSYPPSSYTLPPQPQPGQQQPHQANSSNFLGMLEDPNTPRDQTR